MKNIKLLLIISGIIIFSHTLVYAQLSFQAAAVQEYNSNPFRSAEAESNFISGYNLTLQYEMDNWGILYSGTKIMFSNSGDRNFYMQTAGIWKNFESSSFSFSTEQRINNELYSYFDYYGVSADFSAQFSFSGIYVYLFPSIEYTSYKNISILDNIKTLFGFSLNKPFETGTALIAGGGINYKIYTQPDITDLFYTIDESDAETDTLVESKNASSITQLTAFARAAQSVTETTGIAVQYTAKKIVNGIAASVKEINLTYGDESEMFDDPVNSEGNSILIELTQILFDDMQVKLGYYNNRKTYPSQGIYDSASNYYTGTDRKDTQNIYSASVEKVFELSGSISLETAVKYHYINNSSNSYWFNYKEHSINFNVGITF